MCGITGFFSTTQVFSEAELHSMTNAITHRGPDADGFYADEVIGFGHRRLKVLDLSDDANQPMTSQNGRYVMVYNGEVYNFQDIAEELKQKFKTVFRTNSDSEVILEAFANYGCEFIEKLNGMFSIAIYDKEKQELFVFRDRLGIKPLYYFWDGKNFAFASELKALTKTKFISLSINKNAVHYFLHLGFIPSPLSIYQSIKKLEAGTWLKISKNKLEQKTYWSVNQKIKEELLSDEDKASKQLNELIEESVHIQLKSDVPYGVFLSGGIDSSLIAAKASKISDTQINTFSIGFKENKFNESVHAKAVAQHLKTNHHEFIVSYTDAIDLIDTVFDTYDEPFGDSSAFPTLLVSKLAKKHVTVCLSGEGGDELFFGYGSHQWANRLNNPIAKSLRKPISKILDKASSKYERHANYFKYPSEELQYSHILSQEQNIFSLDELNDLLTSDFKKVEGTQNTGILNSFGLEINYTLRKLKPIEKQAIFDINFYLQNDLLCKVDRASMHYSLETRVPYLDHRIVEFALNLSPNLKYKDGTAKYLLKKLLYQHVPKKMFDRPKQGFAIPLEGWLQNELRFLIEENLSKERIEQYNVVKYDTVETLLNNFFNGKTYLYNRIWLLIVLHKWLKKNT